MLVTSMGRYRDAVQYPTVHGITKNDLAENVMSTRLRSSGLNKLDV